MDIDFIPLLYPYFPAREDITKACNTIKNFLKLFTFNSCNQLPVVCSCSLSPCKVPVGIILSGVINGTHTIPRTPIELVKVGNGKVTAMMKLKLGTKLCLNDYVRLMPLISPHIMWLLNGGVCNTSGLSLADGIFDGSAQISFGLNGNLTLHHSARRLQEQDGAERIVYLIQATGQLPFYYRGIAPNNQLVFHLNERATGNVFGSTSFETLVNSLSLKLKFFYKPSQNPDYPSYNNSILTVSHSEARIGGFVDRLTFDLTGKISNVQVGEG